jgi:hypothetical protein
MLINQNIVPDIKNIITNAKEKAIRAVDSERALMYWHIGKRIFEEEQQGKERAAYGEYLIKFLSQQLQPEYGSGFSYRQLNWYRQFYRTFPIVSALRTQLSWTQYKLLISLDTEDKRTFYIAESIKNNWTSRQLERQIDSSLYERLLLSNDKESVLAVAKNEKLPHESPTIGILLCANKNDSAVKFTLPENNKQIIASQYKLYLPTEQQLLEELRKELKQREPIAEL